MNNVLHPWFENLQMLASQFIKFWYVLKHRTAFGGGCMSVCVCTRMHVCVCNSLLFARWILWVLSSLYSAVSLDYVRTWHFIRMTYYYYYNFYCYRRHLLPPLFFFCMIYGQKSDLPSLILWSILDTKSIAFSARYSEVSHIPLRFFGLE